MQRDKNGNDITNRIAAAEADIGDIRAAVGALTATTDRIAISLDAIQTRLSQPPPETNWVGIGTLIIGVASVLAVVGTAFLEPVAKQTSNNEQGLQSLSGRIGDMREQRAELAGRVGRNEEWLRSLQDASSYDRKQLADIREKIAAECKP
jgi:membrane protein implicated in regulation of membrane protease activity